jgi:hypothetical protein
LIIKAISHASTCKAQGTIIIPIWKSAHFWPVLCSDGVHWSEFIQGGLILPNSAKLFIKGKARNSIFGNKSLKFQMVALRIDFSHMARCRNLIATI